MKTIPRPEHPRPQMVRSDWQSLNGEWEFAFDFSNSGKARAMYEDGCFDKSIVVPFCPESKLSGIQHTDFIPAVWYRKKISITKKQLEGRTLLHFGAVDYLAEVWVNQKAAGGHNGGYTSFTLDITAFLHEGENTIVVSAQDNLRSGLQPFGKQSPEYYSFACSYTRTTGIWQTVWLEFVPKTYIENYRIIPDPDNSCARIEVFISGDYDKTKLTASAKFNGREMGSATAITAGQTAALTLFVNEVHLWDVGQPNLYDLTLSLESGDSVRCYFGLRTVEWHDKAIYLNGKIVFQRLILDQSFFPDGIYTAPTDDDIKRDIQLAIDLGFNGARMHEKVFEERYLYWADKLGYMVWGEMANWGLDITDATGLKGFLPEWVESMRRDFNHPALIGWCPFNETWDNGETGARQDNSVLEITYKMTKALDPTRPVIDTSGNFHVVTDIYDIHWYEQEPEIFRKGFAEAFARGEVYDEHKNRQCYGGQPYFVSEYGGTWWNAEAAKTDTEATDRKEAWGYGNRPNSEEEVCRRYVGLTGVLMDFPEICGFCYTQLTDVEQEQNGLYDYNRNKKFSDETYKRIREVNTAIAAIEKKNK